MDVSPIDDPHESATAVWRATFHSLDHTPYTRWCAGQATVHADRLAALHPAAPDVGTVLAIRDETWHQNALDWYLMLADRPEPDTDLLNVCTVATDDAIRAWLDGPAPHPSRHAMREFLALQYVRPGAAEPVSLPALLEHAQHAGLFGIPFHTIHVHVVTDHSSRTTVHLFTIHTPTGAIIAAGPVDTLDLTHGITGPPSEFTTTVLHNSATTIDAALAAAGAAEIQEHRRARPFPLLGPAERASRAVDPQTLMPAPRRTPPRSL